MSDHLGHSMNIHTLVCKLQSNLMAIENGGVTKSAEARQLDKAEVPVNGK